MEASMEVTTAIIKGQKATKELRKR